MILTIIAIILFIILVVIFSMKLSELDEEIHNLYELLSDYQMRMKDNEN